MVDYAALDESPASSSVLSTPRWHAATRYALALLPLVGALVLWALSLQHIDPNHLGKGGLPPALPLGWYAALAVLIAGASLSTWARRPNLFLMIAYIAGTIVVLHCTMPAITDFPQYSWLYKHVGVVRFIEAHGGLDRSVDLYNRWPGFFALAAAFSSWVNLDALSYAAWAGPFFALVDAMLVAAMGFAIGRDRRIAGYSALIFTVGNWVGQGYFAPQAAAFTLTMALMLVFVRTFALGNVRPRLVSILARLFRREQPPQLQPFALSLGWNTRAAGAIVLILDVAIVVTHQLTPFLLLSGLAALFLIGVTYARWLILLMAVITVGFLLPNLGYMIHHYGLFTGFDPLNNVGHGATQVSNLNLFQSNAGGMLSVMLSLLALWAAFRMGRRGKGRTAFTLLALAVAPFVLLFTQDYNGEASLRVFLFSSPWRDVIISLGLLTLAGHRLRQIAALSICAVLAVFFIQAFYGLAEVEVIPPGEVSASEYYYNHAPAGSVLMQASIGDFPSRLGPRYAVMSGPQEEDRPNLLGSPNFIDRPLGSADIPAVISEIHQYSHKGFLIFTRSAYREEVLYALSPPAALRSLEHAVAASNRFRLWFSDADARIYKLVGRDGS